MKKLLLLVLLAGCSTCGIYDAKLAADNYARLAFGGFVNSCSKTTLEAVSGAPLYKCDANWSDDGRTRYASVYVDSGTCEASE